jgi:hypothetical protein
LVAKKCDRLLRELLVYSENKAEGRRQTAEGIKIFIGGAVLKVHDPLSSSYHEDKADRTEALINEMESQVTSVKSEIEK